MTAPDMDALRAAIYAARDDALRMMNEPRVQVHVIAGCDRDLRVLDRHYEVVWHEANDDGTLNPEKPLPPFCGYCSDEDDVAAVEYGDIIDVGTDVAPWPCPDVVDVCAVYGLDGTE